MHYRENAQNTKKILKKQRRVNAIQLRKDSERIKSQPFQCSYCERSFKVKRSFFKHIKAIHPTKPVLRCSLCQKMFFKSNEVDEHKFRCKKRRILECVFCNFTFKDSQVIWKSSITNLQQRFHVKSVTKHYGRKNVFLLMSGPDIPKLYRSNAHFVNANMHCQVHCKHTRKCVRKIKTGNIELIYRAHNIIFNGLQKHLNVKSENEH